MTLKSIGMGVVSFEKNSGEIINLNARNCLNNLDVINSLTPLQAHYLGFLIGIGLDVGKIIYSKTDKPYLVIK
jgi:hypothetical protein